MPRTSNVFGCREFRHSRFERLGNLPAILADPAFAATRIAAANAAYHPMQTASQALTVERGPPTIFRYTLFEGCTACRAARSLAGPRTASAGSLAEESIKMALQLPIAGRSERCPGQHRLPSNGAARSSTL
jgi:hypothetical protein